MQLVDAAGDLALVYDILPGSGSSAIDDLTELNGKLYFEAEGANGEELFSLQICDAGAGNPCVEDCAGVFGGYATEDDCGVCDTSPTNDCDGP